MKSRFIIFMAVLLMGNTFAVERERSSARRKCPLSFLNIRRLAWLFKKPEESSALKNVVEIPLSIKPVSIHLPVPLVQMVLLFYEGDELKPEAKSFENAWEKAKELFQVVERPYVLFYNPESRIGMVGGIDHPGASEHRVLAEMIPESRKVIGGVRYENIASGMHIRNSSTFKEFDGVGVLRRNFQVTLDPLFSLEDFLAQLKKDLVSKH